MKTETVIKALDALNKALDLDGSESSTETLFWILASALRPGAITRLTRELKQSHKQGLCLDMRYPLAREILRAAGPHLKNVEQ